VAEIDAANTGIAQRILDAVTCCGEYAETMEARGDLLSVHSRRKSGRNGLPIK
jgi:hypothetical protein